MAKDTLHVAPADEHWAVKREGNERASATHGTQKEAIDAARGLAHEGADVVIHRPDGTIREKTTITASTAEQNGEGTQARSELRPSDVMSVGSRVSWGAVVAGVVVALAVYITLNLLVVAIGVTTVDQVASKTFAIVAAIASIVCLLVALFVGGCVASASTVGEEKSEAMIYGVLVWATMLLLLVPMGTGLGVGFFGGARDSRLTGDAAATAATTNNEPNPPAQSAEPFAKVWQQSQSLTESFGPVALAWWTFGVVVLSIFATLAGSLAGAGPNLALKQLRGKRVAVMVRPS